MFERSLEGSYGQKTDKSKLKYPPDALTQTVL